MDILGFISNLVGSLAWPAAVFTGFLVFKDPLVRILNSIKSARIGNVEVELAAPEDTGKQEITAIVSYLQRSLHSYQWFRENTEFDYTNSEFEALINKYPILLEKITVVSQDESKRKSTPGIPGIRLKHEARQNIEQAIEKALQKK